MYHHFNSYICCIHFFSKFNAFDWRIIIQTHTRTIQIKWKFVSSNLLTYLLFIKILNENWYLYTISELEFNKRYHIGLSIEIIASSNNHSQKSFVWIFCYYGFSNVFDSALLFSQMHTKKNISIWKG